jgi:hypothetical protein
LPFAPLHAAAPPALHDVTSSPCGTATPARHRPLRPCPCALARRRPAGPARRHLVTLRHRHPCAPSPFAPLPLCPTRRRPVGLARRRPCALRATAPTPFAPSPYWPCAPSPLRPVCRCPVGEDTPEEVLAENRSVTYGERRRVHRRREITKATLRSNLKTKLKCLTLNRRSSHLCSSPFKHKE